MHGVCRDKLLRRKETARTYSEMSPGARWLSRSFKVNAKTFRALSRTLLSAVEVVLDVIQCRGEKCTFNEYLTSIRRQSMNCHLFIFKNSETNKKLRQECCSLPELSWGFWNDLVLKNVGKPFISLSRRTAKECSTLWFETQFLGLAMNKIWFDFFMLLKIKFSATTRVLR